MARYTLLFGPLIIETMVVFSTAFYATFFAQPIRADTAVVGVGTGLIVGPGRCGNAAVADLNETWLAKAGRGEAAAHR